MREGRRWQELTSRDRVSGHPLWEEELLTSHGPHCDIDWKEKCEGLAEKARPHLAGVHRQRQCGGGQRQSLQAHLSQDLKGLQCRQGRWAACCVAEPLESSHGLSRHGQAPTQGCTTSCWDLVCALLTSAEVTTYFIFSKSWVSPSWAEKTNNYRVCVNIFRYNIHSKDIQQYLYNWLSTPLRNTNCWRKWRCWELISVIDSFCYCFVISAFTFIHLKKLILCITKIQTH